MVLASNGFSETPDLQTAAIIHASGVPYVKTEIRQGESQAIFVFEKTPPALLAQLQTLSVMVNGFALFRSWNFLRDELEEAKRRRVR